MWRGSQALAHQKQARCLFPQRGRGVFAESFMECNYVLRYGRLGSGQIKLNAETLLFGLKYSRKIR